MVIDVESICSIGFGDWSMAFSLLVGRPTVAAQLVVTAGNMRQQA
jgi:hypothetical protein